MTIVTSYNTREYISQNPYHIHENVFHRGYRDFRAGKLTSPFILNSMLDKEWQRGQDAAYFRNLSYVKSREMNRNINSNNFAGV